MGNCVFTRDAYNSATSSRGIDFSSHDGRKHHATAAGEEHVRRTGKLDPVVDPKTAPIHRSLLRFMPTPDGKWRVSVGCPVNVESIVDTTGSMGNNVDIAMKVLPDTYDCCAEMLPGKDLQLSIGIFGDYDDRFILCRPQFEMEAEKIVDYMSRMNPEHGGNGNGGEDPIYGIFAAAFLTDAYLNRIGLKGYHFVTTDEPTHEINSRQMERVFGEHVWEEIAANGNPQITKYEFPDNQSIVAELHKKMHAFAIVRKAYYRGDRTTASWEKLYGKDRVVEIDDTHCLPQIQAAIIGLTEGVLQPMDVEKYLRDHEVSNDNIVAAMPGLRRIKFGAQRILAENAGYHIPQKGDIFAEKTDLQPTDDALPTDQPSGDETVWL